MARDVIDAIVIHKEQSAEVRCQNCGKLLFKIEEKRKKCVDNSSPYVIIVSRCTRNSCKQDNKVVLNASL